MASMESDDNQAQIRGTDMNELTVRWGILSYKSITVEYKTILIATIFSLFFWSLPHGGSLTLYSSLRTILILHLLIIWALTWVSIPSNTLSGFLWVVVAKAALFRGLLNINAARKVAVVYSMWWQQLSLRYFWVPIILIRLWCTSLSLELPGRSPWLLEYIFELYLSCLKRYSSLDHPPICILLIKSRVWTIHYHSFFLGLLMLSAKAQNPIYDLGP